MNPLIRILSGLLVIQVLIILGINFINFKGTGSPNDPLISIKTDQINQLKIDKLNEKKLVLIKKEGAWKIQDYFDFPVSEQKLNQFLLKLSSLKKTLVVAKTKETAKRFKVTESNYEIKITIGDQILLMGASPGYQKVYTRLSKQPEIYAVKFGAYEANTDPKEWIDKTLFHVNPSDVTRIELPTFTLERQGDFFVLKGLKEHEEMIEAKVKRLVSKLTSMSFQEILGDKNKAIYRQKSPLFSYTLILSSGQSIQYAFSKPRKADYAVLKVSSRKEYVKLQSYSIDSLMKTTKQNFIQKKEKETGQSDTLKKK